MMTRAGKISVATLALIVCAAMSIAQTVRVKDIASIEGVRANQLMGYGLVVGLDGSGDSQQTKFTAQSVANMLQNYGIIIPADKLKIKNVAAVMVTAALPPFARQGSTIDVVVSSLGDARSLQGGTLLQTPLRAANGQVYAVAQGPVSVGGFSAGGGGDTVSKNHSAAGRIPSGALVEKETKTEMAPQDSLSITLSRNDFTTAARVADAINGKIGQAVASAVDGNVVSVRVPADRKPNLVSLIAEIETVQVTVDTVAKVIVNERTGTVVIGGQARILPVAVAHGSLTVEVTTDYKVSQPEPVSDGTTVVTPAKDVKVAEEDAHLVEIPGGSTIEELVRALNALRVTPRDLIAVLQAVKEAGALQAQLEVI